MALCHRCDGYGRRLGVKCVECDGAGRMMYTDADFAPAPLVVEEERDMTWLTGMPEWITPRTKLRD